MKSKTFFTVIMLFILFLSAVAAAEPVRIVTTIFPIYDWVREIVGTGTDHVDITLLLDDGIDLWYDPASKRISERKDDFSWPTDLKERQMAVVHDVKLPWGDE